MVPVVYQLPLKRGVLTLSLGAMEVAKGVMKPGVYVFTCLVNGKKYIGSSSGVSGRVSDHIRGVSSNAALQKDIKTFGLAQFELAVYLLPTGVDKSIILGLEQFLILTLGPEYNIILAVSGKGSEKV